MRNNTYEATKALYRLKRSLAYPVVVQKITATTRDSECGTRVRTFEHHHVKRAVVGNTDVLKKFVYDLAYIAANKNFTTGALFDQYDVLFIIDGNDLPKGVEINHDTRIIRDAQLHEIKSYTSSADNKSYIIHARYLEQYEKFEFVSQHLNFRGDTVD